MGLGKTVIGIAAAERLFEEDKIDLCVVVCPAAIKFQWEQRIGEFSGSKCVVIDGSASARRSQFTALVSDDVVHYIVLSHDCCVRDGNLLASLVSSRRCMAILDEATAIKTFKAKRTKAIKRLLRTRYRLALTGTPIENRPDELFSIMQWVDDKVLGRYDLFDKAYCSRNHFGWIIGYKNLPVLRKRIAPAMSRKSRLDPDVRPYLPEVDYTEDWISEISQPVKELYKLIAGDMLAEMSNLSPNERFDIHEFYSGGDESSAQGKLMAMYLCLEMLLDHPDLIIFSAKSGAKYANYLWQEGMLDDLVDSQKLDLLLEKMDDILSFKGNKVVIFSFYRHMLDIIQEELDVKSIQFHGELSNAERANAILRFSTDDECRVLLSSHAGAYGSDLYMANYLINYDQPWSSGKADQINGRHVRVSSEFDNVFVRDLVAKDTVNEWKKRKIDRKRRIAGAVLDGRGQDDAGSIDLAGDSLKDHLLWVTKNW